MATKPMFRVLSKESHPNLKIYEIVMPDGIRWRYAYGHWHKINNEPLTRLREIKDRDQEYAVAQ